MKIVIIKRNNNSNVDTRSVTIAISNDSKVVSICFIVVLTFYRRYARWFGSDGDAGPRLCSYALKNYAMWETKIEEWQNPVLSNKYVNILNIYICMTNK